MPLPSLQSKRSSVRGILPIRVSTAAPKPYKKGKIPKALREALWLKWSGKEFETKCQTTWCPNRITAYDFQAGHDVPECKGGATTLENLVPICSRCNLSMGSQYTFREWCALEHSAQQQQQSRPQPPWWSRFFRCFQTRAAITPPVLPVGPAVIVQPTRPRRSTPKNRGSI